MTEERYLEMMRQLGEEDRPAPPLDAMWARIEREHFGSSRRTSLLHTRRLYLAAGLAATLLLGIAIGRASLTTSGGAAGVVADAEASPPRAAAAAMDAGPFRLVAHEYLGHTVALLSALPEASDRGSVGRAFITQADELLSATRLLLDSPAANEPQMRALLSDLELILAQVSHLGERQNEQEVRLINEALEQREVLPRLRLAAAAAEYPLGL